MKEKFIRGTGVALVTPFLKDGSIDLPSLGKIIDYTIDHGVDYLVSLGTTGETPTLDHDEKIKVLEFTISHCNHRVPVVAGIGGNDTRAVIQNLNQYPLEKVAAILSVAPYYNKPTMEGMYQHFTQVCKNTDKPIILYNVPGRTVSNLTPDTIMRIAIENENVIAIKEASGNIVQNMNIIAQANERFAVLSGDDDLVLPQLAVGLQGVISVAANCFAEDFCAMVKHGLKNEFEHARELHYKLLPGINLLFANGNPAGVKYVLSKMGLCENNLRLPLVGVSDGVAQEIDLFLKNYK
jgi:4-hydroxy-tetrahydrodipicolinate synthase